MATAAAKVRNASAGVDMLRSLRPCGYVLETSMFGRTAKDAILVKVPSRIHAFLEHEDRMDECVRLWEF